MEDVPGPEAPEEPPVWDQPPADEPPSPPPHAVDDGPGEAADTGDAVVEYLAFRLGSEEYAVRVEDVLEIIRLQKITDVPRAPGFVRGIISLRGVIIPVFDIKKRLGFDEAEHTRATRIVVVSEEGMPQGVIVDKVTGVVRFPMKTIEPPPAVIGGVEAEYIQGVGRMGDRLLILLNTGRILAMEG
ncbi:MAG: purine-binding chemotaxis protein CheW [Nitrospirae bacterium]|nr:purine-binding chemotaxis protein CheW [Nitrospirota bacterium]MBI5694180.1 purine-binding chemotaxis protein CheW [Nitrospirota bacterium]